MADEDKPTPTRNQMLMAIADIAINAWLIENRGNRCQVAATPPPAEPMEELPPVEKKPAQSRSKKSN